ncbi:helix-turn-helix domain-containing protein [Xylophilus sp. Kf1]|nr:helix-turn-helix domain-containing protein [Xylophilus sp. Kf1]
MPASDTGQRGIQSVEVGGQLLQALAHHGAPMALKDLARGAGMAAAKAHPYLVSFGRLGLVAQQDDGRYALGSLALEMGLISLQQSSPVHAATPLLAPLAQRIGQTVAIAVWGARGPTIVRVEESPEVVFASLRHGTVFSLAGTASGRLFAAYLEPSRVRALLEAERDASRVAGPHGAGAPAREPVPSWTDFQRLLAEVRARGLGRSVSEIVEGINAMAAPVFGPAGDMVLALISIGPHGTFDTAPDGPIALALKETAAEAGRRLGGRAPAA